LKLLATYALADHRGDRQAWLLATLGLSANGDTGRYRWETVTPSDSDYLPVPERLTRVVAERMQWKRALDEARQRAQETGTDPPASERAA
jgi:hypothetical protein